MDFQVKTIASSSSMGAQGFEPFNPRTSLVFFPLLAYAQAFHFHFVVWLFLAISVPYITRNVLVHSAFLLALHSSPQLLSFVSPSRDKLPPLQFIGP